ncbi:MAG: flavodoxin family protein, partial [Desulfovibrio sp.]|nr:flavodoxin family protein [Desulfovibrio sp.]
MKIIAINGSPRKDGNTRLLLETVLEPLAGAGWDTELVQIGGRAIHGCRACGKCFELRNQRCAFGKDILNEVLEKMLSADAILLGSPTYFADVSA